MFIIEVVSRYGHAVFLGDVALIWKMWAGNQKVVGLKPCKVWIMNCYFLEMLVFAI